VSASPPPGFPEPTEASYLRIVLLPWAPPGRRHRNETPCGLAHSAHRLRRRPRPPHNRRII
jgi:hypothetical protein